MRIKSIQEILLYFLGKIAVLKTEAVLKIGKSKIYLLTEKMFVILDCFGKFG